MVVHTFKRGHKIIYLPCKGYIYADTGEPISVERPCKKCGKIPTEEGHDACLGTLKGVMFACCGHGTEDGYSMDFEGRSTKI